MKLIILGDIHGHWAGANATVQSALRDHPDATAVISLGDLGDGWPTKGGYNRWKPDFDLPIYVVDGNHENFDAIESGNINPKLRWIKRGDFITFGERRQNCMFFGGATSPDRDQRIVGRTWWPQESITREQVDYALNCEYRIDVIFAHERAECFPIPKDKQPVMWGDKCGMSDRVALEAIVRKHQPRFYFHGHWHWGHEREYYINHFDGCVSRMPEGPRFDVKVIACPVINEQETNWTVFDGQNIWKNWS